MFKTKLTNNFGLMGLAICAVSILYVQLWFAIFWTKNIGVAIEGVQGRYFIVVFMFVAYFAAHLAKQKRNLFFALVMFGVLLQTMLTVITRYYK